MIPKCARLRAIAAVMCVLIGGGISFAQTEPNKTKLINLVYDDSSSMIKNDAGQYVDTWCRAKYAMEVFAAMLDSNDTLNVFAMSDFMEKPEAPPRVVIKGSQAAASRVDVIHGMITTSRGTPYAAVKKAFADLSRTQADDKWLVILTDGEFTNVPSAVVNADLRNFTRQGGIKVVFLSIGEVANEIVSDEGAGIFLYRASSAEEILGKLTVACNRIFQRNALAFEDSAKHRFSFDVPMKELFVFAQGPATSLEGMRGEKGEYGPSSSTKVRYSEKAAINYLADANVLIDRNLTGSVSIFNDLPAGTYTLDLKGASTAEIYYKPNVRIGVKLYSGTEEVTAKEKLVGGDYRVDFGFMDENESFYQSALLGKVDYTASVYNNGSLVKSGVAPGEVVALEQGDARVEVTAKFLGYNTVSSTLGYRILQPAIPLELELRGVESPFALSDLGSRRNALTLTVAQKGRPLARDQWLAMEPPSVKTKSDVEFAVERGADVSTFKVYPLWKGNDKFKTASGDVALEISADMLYDEQLSRGKTQAAIKIRDDISALERFRHWWSEYGTLASILLALFVILMGYVPPFKKYLPGRLNKKPVIHESAASYTSMLPPSDHRGKTSIKPFSTYLPYVPQSADIQFLPRGIARGFPNVLRVRALGSGRMLLKNVKDFAGKNNVQFNGESFPKDIKTKTITLGTTISSETEGRRYECKLRK